MLGTPDSSSLVVMSRLVVTWKSSESCQWKTKRSSTSFGPNQLCPVIAGEHRSILIDKEQRWKMKKRIFMLNTAKNTFSKKNYCLAQADKRARTTDHWKCVTQQAPHHATSTLRLVGEVTSIFKGQSGLRFCVCGCTDLQAFKLQNNCFTLNQ